MDKSSNEVVKGVQVYHNIIKGDIIKKKTKESGYPRTSSYKEEASKVREWYAWMQGEAKMKIRSCQEARSSTHRCNRASKESTWELERLGVHAS